MITDEKVEQLLERITALETRVEELEQVKKVSRVLVQPVRTEDTCNSS